MSTFRFALAGVFTCLAIFLFVTAPVELPDDANMSSDARSLDVTRMFNAVNAINHAARSIYTERIVGGGKAAGLKFGEDWAEPGVEKGPLPALFLRLAAQKMEAKPPRLGLYLGSDAPINKSNLFSESQMTAFEQVKLKKAPVYQSLDTIGEIAMFPDFASVQPCVTCHNEHDDSPKKDWKIDDVMGATTWTYPTSMVGAADYLAVTEAFFRSVEEAYGDYLEKASSFSDPIAVSTMWPSKDNLVLPDAATFMTEVRRRAAEEVVSELVLVAEGAQSEADQ